MWPPEIIVGHLAPDLDCLTAIWILVRFGNVHNAKLVFVPAGTTLHDAPPDSDPCIIHVDTGGGRFDHHDRSDLSLSASELVRRFVVPDDAPLKRLVDRVTQLDNVTVPSEQRSAFFNINDLINGYNALFPNYPHHVAQAMMPNLDAWYEHEVRQLRLERAFAQRLEFDTRWGLGIAMQSDDGGSSRLAYSRGAVLYAYRDGRGYMGIAAQSRSDVDLEPIYFDLQRVDSSADWFLHPNRRLLLCGTPKAPPRQRSRLSLEELVNVIKGDMINERC